MATSTLHSVRNALRIIRTLSDQERGLGVSELARRLDLGKSTVHRILATLCADGFVRQTPKGAYTAGFALWELGTQMIDRQRLIDVAHDELVSLYAQLRTPIVLSVLDGLDALAIHRVPPASAAVERIRPHRAQAIMVASGQVILAFSPSSECDRVMKVELTYGRSARVVRGFREEILSVVRRRGYAQTTDASTSSTLAVPVFDAEGTVVGAISCIELTSRDDDAWRTIIEALTAAANEVSRTGGDVI